MIADMKPIARLIGTLLPVLLLGCATAPPAVSSHDQFLSQLRTLCGKSFSGSVVVNTFPATSTSLWAMAGQSLVMHVRDCEADVVRIPFHVGADRSRTWIVTRTATGLRLKHDHRHADGSEDAVTQYGGDTADAGSATRQKFPVDAESIAMDIRLKSPVGTLTNTWAIDVLPGRTFVYELARPGGELFRVAFDLTTPVATPPPAWGYTPR